MTHAHRTRMQVLLIHNPGAGRQSDRDADRLVELLHHAGHEVRYQSSTDVAWDLALETPPDLVAVAGGDGTVSRVAKHVAGRGIPVTVLPSGTANNISRTLGLHGRPFDELISGWPGARRIKLDVGVARGPWGERRFVEGVGAGLFSCLLSDEGSERTLTRIARPDQRVASALQMLADRAVDCVEIDLNATLDGNDISGRYVLFEAVNILYVGPNLFLAPDSEPGDGTFDVVLATAAQRNRLAEYLAKWQDNRERLAVLPTHRGKHLRVEWTGFHMHIDDELWPANGETPPLQQGTIELTIDGRTVEFLVPDAAAA